jgi:hypothetical protein
MPKEFLDMDFYEATYSIKIEDKGVIVFGCDCAAPMNDEEAEKVYWALEEYLISKGKLSERQG